MLSIKNLRESDFANLLVYEFFKNFALSMLGIFIPILIYSETGSLQMSAYYLLTLSLTGLLISYPVMKFLKNAGFSKGLSLSYLFLLPAVIIIYSFELSLPTVVFAAVIYATGSTFHRHSMNLEFAENSTEEDRDLETAHLMSVPNVGRLLGPIVGGAVSAAFGFRSMLMVAGFAIAISIIPVRLMDRKFDSSSISLRSLLKVDYSNYAPVFISRGIQALTSVALFSLFTYVVVGGTFASGLVRSLDTVGFIAVAYFSGFITQRFSRISVIATGLLGASITYLARIPITTSLGAFAVSLVGGVAFKLYHIPLFSDFADRANNTNKTEFYTIERTFNSLGKLLTASAFLISLQYLPPRQSFQIVFLLAAITTPLVILYNKK